MAKKGKPKRPKRADDDGDGSLETLPYHGLLVKIKAKVGGDFGGKMFLIPSSELYRFLFTPKDQGAFDAAIKDPLWNVDYAVYTDDFKIRGSAGG